MYLLLQGHKDRAPPDRAQTLGVVTGSIFPLHKLYHSLVDQICRSGSHAAVFAAAQGGEEPDVEEYMCPLSLHPEATPSGSLATICIKHGPLQR